MTNHVGSNLPAAACPRCGGWTSSGGMSQWSKTLDVNHGRTGCICGGPKTYVFEWRQGGYNTVEAFNLREARKKMVALASNLQAGGVMLTPAERTIHLAKPGEVRKLDEKYGAMLR